MKQIFLIGFIILIVLDLPAQNPIVRAGIYLADPAAHVWDDGQIYLYVSVDEFVDYSCSHRYHILSSDNMVDWTLHENVFASKGKNDQVPYSDALLYAPDCQYNNGNYYLYYPLASGQKTEGG